MAGGRGFQTVLRTSPPTPSFIDSKACFGVIDSYECFASFDCIGGFDSKAANVVKESIASKNVFDRIAFKEG